MKTLIKANIKKHKIIYIFILISILYMVTTIINPIFSAALINNLTQKINIPQAYWLVFIILIILIFEQILYYIKYYSKMILTYKLQKEMEEQILLNLYKTNYLKLINEDKIYLSQRIHTETNLVSNFVFEHLANIITNVLVFLLATIILFQIHPLYALISVVSIPIYLLLIYKMKDNVYNAQMLGKESDAKLKSTFNEQIKMIPTVKLNNIWKESLSIFNNSFQLFINASKRIFNFMYVFYSIDGYLTAIVQAVFFIYGIKLIYDGEMNIGEFTMVLSYYSLIMGTVKYFLELSREYINFKTSIDYLDEILNLEKEIEGSIVINDINNISIDKFSFQYDSSEEIHYKECEFENSGLILLKGSNGSGKSTLIKFMATLYQTDKYAFKINEIPINELNLEVLRKKFISYVEQEAILWDLSLQENIMLHFKEIDSFNKFEKKISDMNLFRFYSSSKPFIEDDWTKKASSFSMGQAKKLSIIIELLKEKSLILLDEPTAALDIESCKELIKFLKEYKRKHLIIVVSHDNLFDNISDFIKEI